ncbi:hypothetical protein P168DRAFT_314241 [Aspergillus campestris IBT 28561]|uniref:Uncharacterized protein n=1 Tax=Aspergillus campestris (strain IBT 28561) TaxID=1392248 RepID=A0A2I1DE40_ASPC2|nr:uncharacterized protein P168DRAFT_314241 [Aspergillus campestris IBT 28561]PKY08116.1 hypothetical protein P168DRAFT_314241 [Aspergillus campestris IBT 28561]
MHPKATLSLLPLLPLVSAMCPGYNWGFFNIGSGKWAIIDSPCHDYVQLSCDNPCDCYDVLGCSPTGSVNKVKVNDLWYNCREEPNKGACPTSASFGGRVPESCCRNDGKRNFEEGRISKRHAEAIENTNGILERHEREFGHAEKRGHDLTKLRRRQLSEVDYYMKREEEAAAALDDE